jgi:hypothetical protein
MKVSKSQSEKPTGPLKVQGWRNVFSAGEKAGSSESLTAAIEAAMNVIFRRSKSTRSGGNSDLRGKTMMKYSLVGFAVNRF